MKRLFENLRRKWHWLGAQAGFQRAPALITFRLTAWGIRCIIGRGTVVKLGRWNLSMYLPARWRGVEKLIFVFREGYEPELAYLERALSPGKTFVDVGANLGIYTLVASRIVGPSGRVIAFEPSAQSLSQLKANITLNGLTNVQVYPAAVSDKIGRAFLYHGPDPAQNSLGRDPRLEPKGEEVVTQSLDRALSQASMERVHVIKIDVEGAEELVLRGADTVVTAHRPIIIFEINQEASTRLGLSPLGAWDLLNRLGYRFGSIRGNAVHDATSLPSLGNVIAIYTPLERGRLIDE
jgi:FkbM family methyltransferase